MRLPVIASQVVGHGAIRGHAALEDDRPLVVEKQIAHAGDDRSGLGATGGRNHVAQRIAILELVDRGGAQHGADRRKLQRRIVIHVLGQLFDGHVQLCRDAVEKCAGAGGADAAHLRHPNLHVVVEQHGLAVLPAHVENGPAIGIVMRRRGDVRRHLADRGVEMHETQQDRRPPGCRWQPCTATSSGLTPASSQKVLQGFGDGAEIASAADAGICPHTPDPA